MLHGHPGHMRTSKRQIVLASGDALSVQKSLFQAETAAIQFTVSRSHPIINEYIMEPNLGAWTSTLSFALRKDFLLQLSVDHCKSNGVNVRNVHWLHRIDKCTY